MEAISKLLNRPWWQRVWVVQEFVLAQEAILMCGKDALNWVIWSQAIDNMTMVLNANVLDYRYSSTIALHEQVDVAAMSKLRQNFKAGLEDILEMTANRYQATERRDLVYGLLGFNSGMNSINIAVRNDLDDSQIFTDLFRSIAEQNHSIRPICRAGRGLAGRITNGLPSWVPDLAYVSPEKRHWPPALMGASRADGGKNCSVRISTGPTPTLSARGYIIDRICCIDQDDRSPTASPTETLWAWFCRSRSQTGHEDDPTGRRKTQAFFNVLIGYLPRSDGPHGMRGSYKDLACGFMLVLGGMARRANEARFLDRETPEAYGTYLQLESVLARHKRLSEVVKGLAYLTLVAKWMDDDLCNHSAQQWVLLLDRENTRIENVIMSAFLGPDDSIAHFQWYNREQRDQGWLNGLIPIPPFTVFDNAPNWSGPKRGAHLGQDSEDLRTQHRFWNHWVGIAARFEFFTTQEGYMGVGPLGLRRDDYLCVLDGCPMPLAIRKARNTGLRADRKVGSADVYEVVGSCYIHGGMSGQLAEDGNSDMLVFV